VGRRRILFSRIRPLGQEPEKYRGQLQPQRNTNINNNWFQPGRKPSIPIVANGRMACAQGSPLFYHNNIQLIFASTDRLWQNRWFHFPYSLCFLRGAPPEQLQGHRTRKAYPTTLILALTRELVAQIHEEAQFSYRSPMAALISISSSTSSSMCDLLSVTPGRSY
jgi:ATP-dependent RNA helicase DDX3X